MARLPEPGKDAGSWGDILNEYLLQSHAEDGTLKTDTVGAPQLKPNAVTNATIATGTIQEAKLHTDVQTKLNAPATIADGSITNAKLQNVGQANGIATLDNQARLPDAQTPERLSETNVNTAIDNAIRAAAITKARALALSMNELRTLITEPTTDIPTVTISATQTITDHLITPQSGLSNVIGTAISWTSSLGRAGVRSWSGVDFIFDGQNLEFKIYGQITGSPALAIRIDGKPLNTISSIATVASNTHYLKLAFPDSRVRRVEIVIAPVAAFFGLYIAHTDTIAPPPRRPRVAFVMDSFGAGSTAASGSESMAYVMAKLLDVECLSASTGGTGYASGGADSFGGPTRVAAVQALNPELIVISGSVNDDGNVGIQAAAAAAYAAYAVACPGVPIVVLGPQPSNATATIGAQRAGVNQAVKAAATAAPNVLAFYDMLGTADALPPAWAAGTYNDGDKVVKDGAVWQVTNGGTTTSNTPGPAASRWSSRTWAYTGTGRIGAPAGDGTRDTFLYSDSVHPTAKGAMALSLYAANAVIDALRNA